MLPASRSAVAASMKSEAKRRQRPLYFILQRPFPVRKKREKSDVALVYIRVLKVLAACLMIWQVRLVWVLHTSSSLSSSLSSSSSSSSSSYPAILPALSGWSWKTSSSSIKTQRKYASQKLPRRPLTASNKERHPSQVDIGGTTAWSPKTSTIMLESTPAPTAPIKNSSEDDEDDEDDNFEYLDKEDRDYASFQDLKYYPVMDSNGNAAIHSVQRKIDPQDADNLNRYREEILDKIDQHEYYEKYEPNEDYVAENHKCQRTQNYSLKHHTCNGIHEVTVERITKRASNDFNVLYLGHGHFRDAWKFYDGTQYFAIKRLRLSDARGGYDDMHSIGRDAVVMERLTSSPRIVDIYGYCATTIVSEVMHSEIAKDIIPGRGTAKQIDLDREENLMPRNQFSVREKLHMALEMAEALADLHGFEEGAIYHADIHPGQWLRAKDGTLKLNDFNSAIIMDYDHAQKDYCYTLTKGKFSGIYRSPEEYKATFVREKCDTYSMGNNIYILLTGLWPFYDQVQRDGNTKQTRHDIVKDGLRPYVDPRWRERSVGEKRLVDIMEAAWLDDPEQRISIFEVIGRLQMAIKEEMMDKS